MADPDGVRGYSWEQAESTMPTFEYPELEYGVMDELANLKLRSRACFSGGPYGNIPGAERKYAMAKALAGSEENLDLFLLRQVGTFTAPNSVKSAACSLTNFSNGDSSLTEPDCDSWSGPDDRFVSGLERTALMVHYAEATALRQSSATSAALVTMDSRWLYSCAWGPGGRP